MKPGNLSEIKVPNPAATRDEGSIVRTSNLRCAVFVFMDDRKENEKWKKDCLLLNV